MSLHAEPTNRAEQFALHLEMKYGLQLDLPRSTALVAELQEFANPTDLNVNPRDPFAAVDPAATVVVPIDRAVATPPYPTDAFVKPADTPVVTDAVAYPEDPFAKVSDAPYQSLARVMDRHLCDGGTVGEPAGIVQASDDVPEAEKNQVLTKAERRSTRNAERHNA